MTDDRRLTCENSKCRIYFDDTESSDGSVIKDYLVVATQGTLPALFRISACSSHTYIISTWWKMCGASSVMGVLRERLRCIEKYARFLWSLFVYECIELFNNFTFVIRIWLREVFDTVSCRPTSGGSIKK